MTEKEKELEWRSQCAYFLKRGKNLEKGICTGSPHAHYADEPCYPCDYCFWMEEYRKEKTK